MKHLPGFSRRVSNAEDRAQLNDKPMTLDERFYVLGRLLRLRSRGDRPFWRWISEVEWVLRDIRPAPATLIETLRSISAPNEVLQSTSDIGSTPESSVDKSATKAGNLNTRVQQIIDTAVGLLETQPMSELGDTLRKTVANSVDAALWESGPVRMMKWLFPLLFAALVGGTIFGAYKVDGVIKLAEQSRNDVKKVYDDYQAKVLETQSLLNKSYGEFQATTAQAQTSLQQLRDGALTRIENQITDEVKSRRDVLDRALTEAQDRALKDMNTATTEARNMALRDINIAMTDSNRGFLQVAEKIAKDKQALFESDFANLEQSANAVVDTQLKELQNSLYAKGLQATDELSIFQNAIGAKGKQAADDLLGFQGGLRAKVKQAGDDLSGFQGDLSAKGKQAAGGLSGFQNDLSAKGKQAAGGLSGFQNDLSAKGKQAADDLSAFQNELQTLLDEAPEQVQSISAQIEALRPVQESMTQLVAAKDKVDHVLDRLDQSINSGTSLWLIRVLAISDFLALAAIVLAFLAILISIISSVRSRRLVASYGRQSLPGPGGLSTTQAT